SLSVHRPAPPSFPTRRSSDLALLLLQTFINHAKTQLTVKTGQHIDARLILGYYKHLLRLPQRFFDTMRTGEPISRINDAVKIRAFINDALITVRSEEHTSELQSRENLVCRLLPEKKKLP